MWLGCGIEEVFAGGMFAGGGFGEGRVQEMGG